MAILLIADHANGQLSEQTARTLTAASAIGREIDILIAGADVTVAAGAAASLMGVRKVLLASGPALVGELAEPLSDLVVDLAAAYEVIVASSTTYGKNVAPRVAARLDVMQVSEIIEVLAPDTFRRPVYAGNAIQTVRATDAKKVITVRTASFAATGSGGAAPVELVALPEASALSTHIGYTHSESDRPDLTSAKVIVSGGRALGSSEQFSTLIVGLADKLGAAAGASRAAVDAGYAPNDWQVGQTGKVVAPELYIAAGISGAIQHLAGMKDSKVIVAINKDPEAPIFQIADYGLVGDLFEIIPELEKAL